MSSSFSFSNVIALKQNSNPLTRDQIQWIIDSIIGKKFHDAQIGAFLMAVFLKGMTIEETIALTSIMTGSGEVLSWPDEWKHLVVDKHSTGGVGDKVSLILAPALAACGLKVPMISGRSLGFTGGTLDKLESIPGFNVNITTDKIQDIVKDVGCCIVGQTLTLVPADKILYSLRDITNTVASAPLICSSIISKKAAEGLSSLVLDVKYGRGSFQCTPTDAENLAKLLVAVGNGVGMKTTALITSMEEPLGMMIGNSLEVLESVHCLQGKGPSDVLDLVIAQGRELLLQQGLAATPEEALSQVIHSISSGRALEVFRLMLVAQGVDEETSKAICKSPETVLPISNHTTDIKSSKSGTVIGIDPLKCAEVSGVLGAGRLKPSDIVTHNTGIQLFKKVGNLIQEGETWATVYHVDKKLSEELILKLESALSVTSENFTDKIKSKIHSIIK
ncbi:thymidine phosphorylase isoform X2 [Hydra vulgaris]|uniref:Thymidine phosphorylase n=1 Tax=Hydra vulgaris TaxID=6087 RepID=A0ABM4D2B6_HYDVU